MAATSTGAAHCPNSNMVISSGIAPIARFLAQGVPVGLGVDGSASNDAGNLLQEARQAMMIQHLSVAPGVGEGEALSARRFLEIATRGGAAVLGRDDIGSLEPGKRADFFTLDIDRIEFAGAHDLVAAALLCGPVPARDVYVEGSPVISGYAHRAIDEGRLAEAHREAAASLV
jgi:cytosine/adenosine deaminase-related metal-dependent hydrolase